MRAKCREEVFTYITLQLEESRFDHSDEEEEEDEEAEAERWWAHRMFVEEQREARRAWNMASLRKVRCSDKWVAKCFYGQ